MNRMRPNKGQAATALNLIVGLFLVAVLGFSSFEYERFMLARDELKVLVEAAALTAETTWASAQDQNTAFATALTLYQSNSILGQLQSSAQIGQLPLMPPPSASTLYFEFLDPITRQPVSGATDGALVEVMGAYAYQPLFASLFSLGQSATFTAMATSLAGVPQVDVVMDLDIGAQSDDRTPITLVQRYWNYNDPITPHIVYYVPPGDGPNSLATGAIGDLLCASGSGNASINALPPQNLQDAINNSICPYYFSEGTPGYQFLRGVTNSGSPPGNYIQPSPPPPPTVPPPGNANGQIFGYTDGNGNFFAGGSMSSGYSPVPSGPANSNSANLLYGPGPKAVFTDCVVNLDGNLAFTYIEQPPYHFFDVGTLVEAQRGNLNSVAVAEGAGLDLGALGMATTSGYYQTYIDLAKAQRQPLQAMQNTSAEFFNSLALSSDVHYGFIAFTDQIGTNPFSTFTDWNVSPDYPLAGNTPTHNLPYIALNPQPGANNLVAIENVIPTLDVDGGRNVPQALKSSLDQLETNSRPTAARAIVLFVAGEPHTDLAGFTNNVQATADSRQQALRAYQDGIPIYIVCVENFTVEGPDEIAAYNDSNADPTSGGICAIAGHGGKFYLEKYPALQNGQIQVDLQTILNNIQRQLVALIR